MTTRIHTLGFPRMGAQRELKFALEKHWRGEIDRAALEAVGEALRARHWQAQRDAGLDFVTVGDFAYYDQVANHTQLLGCEPARFGFNGEEPELARYFKMARGVEDEAGHVHDDRCNHGNEGILALEMTKWFDTNYHYLVPEFNAATRFKLASARLFDEVAQAQRAGHAVKAVLLGPLSFLYLGKEKEAGFDRFSLLDQLLPVYEQVLARLKQQGVEWVQVDEPILGLDLPEAWRNAFERAYWQLARGAPKLLLATYFSPLSNNLRLACQLPVAGLHVDAVRAPQELTGVADWLPAHKVLSLGVVDGRNVWRTDLDAALAKLKPVVEKHKGELWIAPSCSLLHVPFSLAAETRLDAELKSWLAFAIEAVRWQEKIGLDVLVHGEFERNDMVEYFGEQLAGFAFTKNGWVQSYGSRCVKPPVIFGDVARPAAHDGVEWTAVRAVAHRAADEGHADRPRHDAAVVLRARRQPRRSCVSPDRARIRDEVLDLEAGASA
jgi:5-methyltetrahydropteroyltriglutamate--homocysteine methyltransferase